MDETALNVLIAEGLDVPTAVAASLEEPPRTERADPRVSPPYSAPFVIGMILGLSLTVVILWIIR